VFGKLLEYDRESEFGLESILMRKLVLVMLVTMLLCSVTFGLLFLSGYVGNSAARVRREHGLELPHSARAFVCRGDAWMHLFMDSGAASAFEMDARDLPSFVAQFKILQTNECLPGCIFPEILSTSSSALGCQAFR
jgi:hypothetical protein